MKFKYAICEQKSYGNNGNFKRWEPLNYKRFITIFLAVFHLGYFLGKRNFRITEIEKK